MVKKEAKSDFILINYVVVCSRFRSRFEFKVVHYIVKFIYPEKATKFCEISTVDVTVTTYIGQIYGGDFTKICGLLRIYEL